MKYITLHLNSVGCICCILVGRRFSFKKQHQYRKAKEIQLMVIIIQTCVFLKTKKLLTSRINNVKQCNSRHSLLKDQCYAGVSREFIGNMQSRLIRLFQSIKYPKRTWKIATSPFKKMRFSVIFSAFIFSNKRGFIIVF